MNGSLSLCFSILLVSFPGVRSKVPRCMPLGAWIDRKDGFNPLDPSAEAEDDENEGDDDYLRYVDPNIPPKVSVFRHIS